MQTIFFARVKEGEITLTRADMFSKFKGENASKEMLTRFFYDANKQIDFRYSPSSRDYRMSEHYKRLIDELSLHEDLRGIVSFVDNANRRFNLALDGQDLQVKVLAATSSESNLRAYDLQISAVPNSGGQPPYRVVLALDGKAIETGKEFAELLCRM